MPCPVDLAQEFQGQGMNTIMTARTTLMAAQEKMEDALALLDQCQQPLIAAQLATALDTLRALLG